MIDREFVSKLKVINRLPRVTFEQQGVYMDKLTTLQGIVLTTDNRSIRNSRLRIINNLINKQIIN